MSEEMERGQLSNQVMMAREGEEPVQAAVRMGAGTLDVGGGAEVLMKGSFTYPDASLQPDVSYDVEDGEGRLVVREPNTEHLSADDSRSAWDVAFDDGVPLGLEIGLGSGKARVRFSDSNLTALRSKIGSGNLDAGLMGTMAALGEVGLRLASGRTRIALDGDFPQLSRYEASCASGILKAALLGSFDQLAAVHLKIASGDVHLVLAGSFPELTTLAFNAVSGTADLELGEAELTTLSVALKCVSGKLTVRYPAETGVSVRAKSLSGKVNAPGFHRVDGKLVNDLYGEADRSIEIDASSVSGTLSVQPADA